MYGDVKLQKNHGQFLRSRQPQRLHTTWLLCYPMDYDVWNMIEEDTDRTACNATAKLIDKIKEGFEVLLIDNMKAACVRFRTRIETVIDDVGGGCANCF